MKVGVWRRRIPMRLCWVTMMLAVVFVGGCGGFRVEPTTALVHAPCGTELEQAFWCRTCATTFGPSAIRGVQADAGSRSD